MKYVHIFNVDLWFIELKDMRWINIANQGTLLSTDKGGIG